MELLQNIATLNNKLSENAENFSLDLFSGKTGLGIYFYYLSRFTGNKKHKFLADSLMDAIVLNIEHMKSYDIKYGLAGVGLGIDFLIDKQFIKGNSNQILKEMDDELFKQLSYPANSGRLDFATQLQILYYFIVRLKKQKQGSEQEWLFKEVIMKTINNLNEIINFDIYDDPLVFSTDYLLPQYLFVLGRCMDIYTDKIVMIVKELSSSILSKIPFLHANRLYMLWGMVSYACQDKRWRSHCDLLRREFDFNEMLNHDFCSGNIYFNDGLPAVYLLLRSLSGYFTETELHKYSQQIIEKIQQSPEWELLINKEDYFKMKSGFFSGWCGTSLLLYYHENRFK